MPVRRPRSPTVTLGSSGLNRQGQYVFEERHRSLRGRRGMRVLAEMRNEAIIGSSMFAINSLIQTAKWKLHPADDSAEAKEVVEFVDSCLNDMEETWDDVLSEILTMLIFGYSIHEVTFKRRSGFNQKFDDGKLGWKSISIRAQQTLHGWEFDDQGRVKGVFQEAPPRLTRVFIPTVKFLHFRTESGKNNPEGRSLFRSAYTSWYFKKRLQEIEAIGMERDLSGFPVMQVPMRLLTSTAPGDVAVRQELETALQQIRVNEKMALLIPSEMDPNTGKPTGYKFELMSASGSRSVDIGKTVERHEHRIAMSVLAQFLQLGQANTGSFAMSAEHGDLFTLAINGIMDRLSEPFNQKGIPQLCSLNGIPTELWPQFLPGEVDRAALAQFGSFVKSLVDSNVLTPDDPLEAYVRDKFGLPPRDRKTERRDPVQPDPMEMAAAQQGPTGGDGKEASRGPIVNGAPPGSMRDKM